MPETEEDSYKIRDGKLKTNPLLLESPLAVLHGCSQMSWHLMAALSRALPASESQPSPGGQLSSACEEGWRFWWEKGPNPPGLPRGTACPCSSVHAAGQETTMLPHEWPAAPPRPHSDFHCFFQRKILSLPLGLKWKFERYLKRKKKEDYDFDSKSLSFVFLFFFFHLSAPKCWGLMMLFNTIKLCNI